MIPAKRIERHFREFSLPGTREADERILHEALDAFEQAGSNQTENVHLHQHNWVPKTVAAIVVIGLLIPLGYGASKMIRTLIVKPAEKTEIRIAFNLDRDIGGDTLDRDLYSALTVGTKEKPNMVHARSVRFFVEDGQLRGTLRASLWSWPKFKWRTRITLLDRTDRRLASTVHISENAGAKHRDWASQARHTIHFTLGPWNNDLQAQATSASIQWEQVSEKTESTPNAWIKSDILPVVYGRVTRPDGRPVAHAVLQIRERPQEGQDGIAAPDVYADAQGFYCFDDIHWAYHVGVLAYGNRTSVDGYNYQYKRLNRVLQGTNKVYFVLEDPPAGTAVVKGQVLAPDGQPIQRFRVRVSTKIDWNDQSEPYLYDFGFNEFVSDAEGRFEISGLPAGEYQVSLNPTLEEAGRRYDDIADSREYTCELTEGKTVDITNTAEDNQAWHGRILFEDGTPAVLPDTETQVLEWSKGYDEGHVTATLDEHGYFTVRFSDATLERLRSGETWLTVNITKTKYLYYETQKETFPFKLMSPEKAKAGTLTIGRPASYYGRILYENGKPAVPPAIPWQWAKVSLRLRCTPATWNSGGITEKLGDLDGHGSFSILLTNGQYEQLAAGEHSLEIMHPSYERERNLSPMGKFPVELLSKDRDAIRVHTLLFEKMPGAHKHLKQCLESYDLIGTLGSLLQKWQAENRGARPARLAQLDSDADPEAFARIVETIEYQPQGTVGPEAEAQIIAYDKILLEKIKGTHVLFSNGTIEFLPQRKLSAIDINQ